MTEDRNAKEDTRQNAEEDLKGTARRRLLKISLSPDEFQVCSFRAQLAMTGGAFQIGFQYETLLDITGLRYAKAPQEKLRRFLFIHGKPYRLPLSSKMFC